MTADEKPGQHGVEGSGPTVAGKQSAVLVLGVHEVSKAFVKARGGLAGIRRTDPVMVFGAHVVVVRQQSQDGATFMAGVAARAARLGLVAP
ncbi:hypothetical protein PJN34_28965 [Mycobacterium kansasii]